MVDYCFKQKSRLGELFIGVLSFIFLTPLYALDSFFVFRKNKEKLGGKQKAAISGSGSLQKEVNDFFRAVGINVLEENGITEAGPVLAIRNEKFSRLNCVGKVFPSCVVKSVAEKNSQIFLNKPLPPGEKGLIFICGKTRHQIMKGFYNKPELTDSVIEKITG